jgi:hypothetical protein
VSVEKLSHRPSLIRLLVDFEDQFIHPGEQEQCQVVIRRLPFKLEGLILNSARHHYMLLPTMPNNTE